MQRHPSLRRCGSPTIEPIMAVTEMKKQNTESEWSQIHLLLHMGMFFCTMYMLICTQQNLVKRCASELDPQQQL